VSCAQEKTKNLLTKSGGTLRAAKFAELNRPNPNPPKVVAIRGVTIVSQSHDRGPFPRAHGHPLDVLEARAKGRRLKTKTPASPTVKLEPRILTGEMKSHRNGKWKRVESFADSDGIPFKGPLTHMAVKAICNISLTLNSLYHLTEMAVTSKKEWRDSVSLFHSTRRFLQNRTRYRKGSFVDSMLVQCAVNLRSTKIKQRLAENRI